MLYAALCAVRATVYATVDSDRVPVTARARGREGELNRFFQNCVSPCFQMISPYFVEIAH